MSKRNTTPTATRGRSAPVKVQKPFPWGTVAGALVLVLALGAILFYAVRNQGAGYEDPLEKADSSFGDALTVTPASEAEGNHVEGTVDYGSDQPPASGDHSGTPAPCQVYTEPAPTEGILHALEHGGVWITYRPDLPADQVSTLTSEYDRQNVAISPFPGQEAPISVQAWTRQLTVDEPGDPRIGQFIDAYVQGQQAPERGVGC